jgi:2-keto-3-deoxy-L-rhamnonate aldolase RhmA
MESRPSNRLRERFETGEVALSILDTTYSPTLVEFYGDLGVDAVWLDLEHGGPSPLDGPTMEHLLLAAERTGTELLVRLPTTDPTLLRKALDLGVRSVFLPRVESAEAVEQAVLVGATIRRRPPSGGSTTSSRCPNSASCSPVPSTSRSDSATPARSTTPTWRRGSRRFGRRRSKPAFRSAVSASGRTT